MWSLCLTGVSDMADAAGTTGRCLANGALHSLPEDINVTRTGMITCGSRSLLTLTSIVQVQYDFLYRSLIDYVTSRNLCDMADTQL